MLNQTVVKDQPSHAACPIWALALDSDNDCFRSQVFVSCRSCPVQEMSSQRGDTNAPVSTWVQSQPSWTVEGMAAKHSHLSLSLHLESRVQPALVPQSPPGRLKHLAARLAGN